MADNWYGTNIPCIPVIQLVALCNSSWLYNSLSFTVQSNRSCESGFNVIHLCVGRVGSRGFNF